MAFKLNYYSFEKIAMIIISLICSGIFSSEKLNAQSNYVYKPFKPEISYEAAGDRADLLLSKLSIDEKIK